MEARSTCRSRSGSLRSSAHSGPIPKAERSSSRKLQTGRIAYSHSSVKRKGTVREIKTVISSYLISVSSSVLLLITRPYWISPCTISIAKHRPAEIAAAVIDTDLTTLASSDNAYAAFLRPCSSSRMCAGVGSHLTTAVPSPTDPNTQRLDDVILSYSSPLKLCGLCCIAGRVLTHLDDSTAEGSIPETPRLPRDGGVSATAVMAAAAAAGRMNALQPAQSQSSDPSGHGLWLTEAEGVPPSPFSFTGTAAPLQDSGPLYGTQSEATSLYDVARVPAAERSMHSMQSGHSTRSMHSMRSEPQLGTRVSAVRDVNAPPQATLWFPKTLGGYISQASTPSHPNPHYIAPELHSVVRYANLMLATAVCETYKMPRTRSELLDPSCHWL